MLRQWLPCHAQLKKAGEGQPITLEMYDHMLYETRGSGCKTCAFWHAEGSLVALCSCQTWPHWRQRTRMDLWGCMLCPTHTWRRAMLLSRAYPWWGTRTTAWVSPTKSGGTCSSTSWRTTLQCPTRMVRAMLLSSHCFWSSSVYTHYQCHSVILAPDSDVSA